MDQPVKEAKNSEFGPKVIDLSPKSGNFRSAKHGRKAFFLGLILVSVLGIVAVVTGFFYIRQRITVPPKAAGNIDDSRWQKTNGRGNAANSSLTLRNISGGPITVRFKKETYWCPDYKIDGPDNGGSPVLKCFKNGQASWESKTVTIPAGGSASAYFVSQPVGGNSKCGAAQVDIYWHIEGTTTDNQGPYWGVAYLDACQTPPLPPPPSSLDCTGVALAGGGTTITKASETRTLTAAANGGTAPITYSWALTSDGTNKGSLSATSGNVVTWTAPATLPTASQTWAITATATDAKGQSDATGCTQTLAFTYTPPTYTHNVCFNNSCVQEDCSPATTDCAKDTDCKSDADCHPKTYQHKACQNNACATVACDPKTSPCSDSCSNDSQCRQAQTQPLPPSPPSATPTHKACVDSSCQTVSGAGADTCTSDVSCAPPAIPPQIPPSGSPELTVVGLLAGVGAVLLGLLLSL